MKVRELIEILKTLDQEKEIKTIIATGWEYENETSENPEVKHYSEHKCLPDYNDEDKEKDFYIIS